MIEAGGVSRRWRERKRPRVERLPSAAAPDTPGKLWRPTSPSADVMSGPGWQESWSGGSTSLISFPPPLLFYPSAALSGTLLYLRLLVSTLVFPPFPLTSDIYCCFIQSTLAPPIICVTSYLAAKSGSKPSDQTSKQETFTLL